MRKTVEYYLGQMPPSPTMSQAGVDVAITVVEELSHPEHRHRQERVEVDAVVVDDDRQDPSVDEVR